MPPDARRRRTEHSSSDSSDAGPFLVSSVRYRVAAPPARPLPNENRWTKECGLIQKFLGVTLENGFADILRKNDIEVTGPPELAFRCVQGDDDSSEGQPTIIAVATWNEKTSPPVWERAVKQTKRFVDAKVLASGPEIRGLNVGVEMIAEELTPNNYVSCIPNNELTESLVRDWDTIKANVGRTLESFPSTQGQVTSISLFKLGSSANLECNPLTVYISVDYESEEARWPPVANEIQRGLDSYGHNLRVHIEHGGPESYAPFRPLLKPMTPQQTQEKRDFFNYSTDRLYKTTVGLGEDIGPAGYIKKPDGEETMPGVGTLGCWVEMKTTTTREWTKYALTNYHVVRPALEGFQLTDKLTPGAPKVPSDLQRADLGGIAPNTKFQSSVMEIEHPTRSKHCFAVGVLENVIKENPPSAERAEKEEYLDSINAFFNDGKHLFGKIFAASGYRRRSPTNGRMDWALIKPLNANRVGKNTLPTFEEWRNTENLPLLVAQGKSLKQPFENGLRSTMNGAFIYKTGSSTGPTVGVFSRIKSDVTIKDDAHLALPVSEEFVYIGEPETERLANSGDSGSVVFDKQGRAVGLLFRGHKAPSALNQFAYITPIEDVFEDIKRFSDGQVTDIRIAED